MLKDRIVETDAWRTKAPFFCTGAMSFGEDCPVLRPLPWPAGDSQPLWQLMISRHCPLLLRCSAVLISGR